MGLLPLDKAVSIIKELMRGKEGLNSDQITLLAIAFQTLDQEVRKALSLPPLSSDGN